MIAHCFKIEVLILTRVTCICTWQHSGQVKEHERNPLAQNERVNRRWNNKQERMLIYQNRLPNHVQVKFHCLFSNRDDHAVHNVVIESSQKKQASSRTKTSAGIPGGLTRFKKHKRGLEDTDSCLEEKSYSGMTTGTSLTNVGVSETQCLNYHLPWVGHSMDF